MWQRVGRCPGTVVAATPRGPWRRWSGDTTTWLWRAMRVAPAHPRSVGTASSPAATPPGEVDRARGPADGGTSPAPPRVGGEYAPTPLALLDRLAAVREAQLSDLGLRWHKQRVAWLVTGDSSITAVPPLPAGVGGEVDATPMAPSSLPPATAAAPGGGDRVDAGDLSDAELQVLMERLAEIKRTRKRRRVRVNAASIRRVLKDPERSDMLSFTRPLPLPQMVELQTEVWEEEANALPPPTPLPASSSTLA